MKEIKLGVIGMSEGNGHPFSWSAIINGDFDAKAMAECGFPVIGEYLGVNRPTLGIEGAKVTHVWTQERAVSEKIAAASLIENVADNLEDMIGNVDAVLLARDDAENHVQMAKPFLDAAVPLFIDKPLAITHEDLDYFVGQNKNGRLLMSCSSMRYAAESQSVRMEMDALGEIELATCVGKKDWPKYGVHMLEGLYALTDDPKAVAVKHISTPRKDIVYVQFETGLLATVHLFYDIAPTFQISLFGQKGWRLIEYKNWYAMFKNNLVEFVRSVREGASRLPFDKTLNVIRALIAAQESLEGGGKTILLQ